MGQYYHPINITKKEYLNPHLFGDSLKLLEFSRSEDGVMTALALLLASGNGHGGGDLYRTPAMDGGGVYGNQGPYEPYPHERIEEEFSTEHGKEPPKTYRTIVPKIVGRWAGDQIVIAGDYMDRGVHLTPDMIEGKTYGDLGFPENRDEPIKMNGVTLYAIAMSFFEDISLDVLWAMLDDEDIRKTFSESGETGDFFREEIIDIYKLKKTDPKKYPLMIHDMKSEKGKKFLEQLIKSYS